MKRLKLISLRKSQNLTQKEVVNRLLTLHDVKITPSYYGMIEQGDRNPSLHVGIAIAKLFRVQLEDIFLVINPTKRCG